MLLDTESRIGQIRKKLIVGVAVVAFAAIGLAACGSNNSGNAANSTKSTTSKTGSTASSSTSKTIASTVSKATLTNTITQALGAPTPAATLPPVMVQALKIASKPLSAAQMQKAYQCWQATSCTLGPGKLTVALADGNDINTWRAFVKMNVILQSLEYPQVGKFIFTNGQGNLSTYESNIRELTAQGASLIVTFNTFGSAAWPAFKAAQAAGVPVSTYVGPTTTAPTSALTTRVQPTICQVGKTMAKAAKAAVGNAPVAYFTGVAGNPEDAGWQKCATQAGLNSVFNADTTWTPAGAQKAASALIASGKTAKAILYSYSTPVPNIVQAYVTAGKPIPAIITFSTNNSTVCLLQKHTFPLYVTDAYNWASRISVTALINKVEGKSAPAAVLYPLPFTPAKASACTATAPGGFPGPSSLVPPSLAKQMLGNS